jgi:hypothetical protein
LTSMGILPSSARANQGLTGAQLMTLIASAQDRFASQNTPLALLPTLPQEGMSGRDESSESRLPTTLPSASLALEDVARENTSAKPSGASRQTGTPSPEPVRRASDSASALSGHPEPLAIAGSSPAGESLSAGRREQLPDIPVGSPPPAIQMQDPVGKPMIIGPDGQIAGRPASAQVPSAPAPGAASPGSSTKESVPSGTPGLSPLQDAGWIKGKPMKSVKKANTITSPTSDASAPDAQGTPAPTPAEPTQQPPSDPKPH